ncbi:hypothetical protein [Gordonia alkanivorans]|uniref:hypothetical protein n=1 Tax=Gordonia alkanivorans TaxID=84096 RepID=UPI0024B84D44|nr:hypothetical protein [Gordonia alkanivorans]MDJ0010110.1 hypothetical protein [Gordonia alkanivorans]MDJ0495700.1 hypothetical protein [Gordonia alkanivorans]
MAALGTYTKTASVTITIDGLSEVVFTGDVDIPVHIKPVSEPGYNLTVDPKPALAQLLRNAADALDR